MQIHELTPDATAAWNEFVFSATNGTFFHRVEWVEVLQRAFGFTNHYLFAEEGGKVIGVLPLVLVRSVLFGSTLASTPYCVYGGALAADPDTAAQLEARVARLAEHMGVDYLELRSTALTRPDWLLSDLYVTFRKTLSRDEAENMKAIPRKQRAMVRKGIKAGPCAEAEGDLDRFFRVYATSTRNHGTPVFPRKYFNTLKQVFGDACDIVTVTENGNAVSSVMSFYHKDEVLPYYGGGLLRARAVKAFDFMYWRVLCAAVEKGCTLFDYGRSKVGSGSCSFKKNWGFEPTPLFYQYHLVKATALPQKNPNNPSYRLLIEAWKKMPLPLANRIGPLISRGLG